MEDVCLLNNATRQIILCGKHFFSYVTLRKTNVHILLDPVEIIDGFGNATIILSNGITLHVNDALLKSKLKRNLLSFQDVLRKEYHLETMNE